LSVPMSIVRQNLLKRPGYTPYCGADRCPHGWPRTKFNGEQFACSCKWQSRYEPEFIDQYMAVNLHVQPITQRVIGFSAETLRECEEKEST
jgi:hypothetical protein